MRPNNDITRRTFTERGFYNTVVSNMSQLSRNTHRLLRAGVSSGVAFIVLLMAAVAFAGPPTDFVKTKSKQLIEIVNQNPSKARTKALKKEARSLIDYEELAKRALGKHWEARSDQEKKDFVQLLESLVELNYADRFKQKSSDANYEVSYLKEKVRKNQAVVKTRVKYSQDQFTIDYKLMERKSADGGFIIYDAVFDDVSLEESYGEAYVPIIEKEGWDALMKRMRDKLKELKAAQ